MTDDRRRTLPQNRFMWPMFRQITDLINAELRGTEHRPLTIDDIHDHLVGMYVAEASIYFPPWGDIIQRRPTTRYMSVADFADMLTFCLAWADEHGLRPVMMPADYEEWNIANRDYET